MAHLALAAQQPAQDVIYYNGHIVTMWDAHPAVQAVAVRGNHFLAAGTLAEVRKAVRTSARMIDLHGLTVLPGLEDSHTHPITSALAEQHGPIPVLRSIPEIQKYIRNSRHSDSEGLLLAARRAPLSDGTTATTQR